VAFSANDAADIGRSCGTILNSDTAAAATCQKIGSRERPEPSTINEKTIADFTRVVEQVGMHPKIRRDLTRLRQLDHVRTGHAGTVIEQAASWRDVLDV
jgi:hypothetical protein